MSYSSSAQGFGLCPGVRCSLEVFSANCSLPIFGMDAQWWEWVWHVKGMGLRGQGMIKKLMPGLQALHDAGVPSSRVSLPSSLRPGSPCLLFPLPKQRGANSGPYDSGAGGGGCFGCRSADAGALCSYILLNLLPEEGARALERGLDGPH